MGAGEVQTDVSFPFDPTGHLDFTLTESASDFNALGLDVVGGDLSITQVPAPGAFLLGAIGLSLVGWVKRKFA